MPSVPYFAAYDSRVYHVSRSCPACPPNSVVIRASHVRTRSLVLCAECRDTPVKRCSVCGRVFPVTAYNALSCQKDGLATACRVCRRARQRKRPISEDGLRKQRERLRKPAREQKSSPEGRRRIAARKRARNAIRSGKLIRPDSCSSCGKRGKPEPHHVDYDKPFDVEWLCGECHSVRHGESRVNPGIVNPEGKSRSPDKMVEDGAFVTRCSEAVRTAVEAFGMSMRDIARETGLSDYAVFRLRYRRTKRPSKKTRDRISNFLDAHADIRDRVPNV